MTGLAQRVGGPNAISWPAFCVVLVASTLMNLPDRYTVYHADTAPGNLLAMLIAVAAMFAVMLGLRAVLLTDVALRAHPLRALAIFAAGAATRGVVFGVLLGTIGTGEPRIAFRVGASLGTLVPILVLTAIAVDFARGYAATSAALRAEGRRLRAEEDEARARASAIQERAAEQVRLLLLDRLAELEGAPAEDLAPRLRTDAEAVIRPLSHDVLGGLASRAMVADDDVGRITVGSVLRAASLGRPYRPLLLAVLTFFASASALTSYDGAVIGIVGAIIASLLVAAAMAVLDRLVAPRLSGLRTVRRYVAMIAGAIAGIAVAAIVLGVLLGAFEAPAPWRLPIMMLTVGPLTVVLIAVGQGFQQQVTAATGELAAVNARLRHAGVVARAAAWHEERRLSRALHGQVQTAVIAAAMRVEAGDRAAAERLLVEALDELDPDRPESGVVDALTDVTEVWEGMCAVCVDIPADVAARVDGHPPLASTFVDICIDACSNAVRHGRARHVEIEARVVGGAVGLVVSDDGAPTGPSSERGMGSALLDDVALSWEREREGARTVLRAALPIGD